MIGKYQMVIGADEFNQGLSTGEYTNDGGFGYLSYNLTPFARPGTIKATKDASNASTNLDNNLIASVEDYQTSGAVTGRILLDAAGKIYSYAAGASSMTLQVTGAQTSKYVFGKSDMVSFASQIWITTTDDLAMLTTGAGAWVYDEDWWTATKSEAAFQTYDPHPLLVFENLLWVADSNKLHYVDTSLAVTNDKLVLPTDEHIYALEIDPGTGLMLISVEKTVNLGGQISTRHIVYLYDGFSSKARRKIFVEDTVFGFRTVGGVVYVGYGNRVGYWNGSGISFLRKLNNVTVSTATSTDMPYKHHFSQYRNFLLVVDGADVICYGKVTPNVKSWFPLIRNPVDTGHLNIVCQLAGENVGIGFPTAKFYYTDVSSTSAGTGRLYTKNIVFPRPVFVRGIRILTSGIQSTGAAATSGIGEVIAYGLDGGQGNTYLPTTKTFVAPGGVVRYFFDFLMNQKCQALTGYVGMDTQGFSIVAAIIYYDPAE